MSRINSHLSSDESPQVMMSGGLARRCIYICKSKLLTDFETDSQILRASPRRLRRSSYRITACSKLALSHLEPHAKPLGHCFLRFITLNEHLQFCVKYSSKHLKCPKGKYTKWKHNSIITYYTVKGEFTWNSHKYI